MKKQNINKNDKLTDKAFSRLVLTSIMGILVCMICLCSTTFAWFTDSAPSEGNEIKMSDECGLTVTVMQDGTPLDNIESGVELDSGVEYTVTLYLPSDTSSGYCLISAGGNTYYTDYILRNSQPQTVTFKLKVETTQTVVFTPRWGIYNTYDSSVSNGELLIP